MKKIIIGLLVFFSFTNIYALHNKNEKLVNSFVNKIESISKKRGDYFIISVSNKFKKALKKGNFKSDKKDIINSIIYALDKKIEDKEKEKIIKKQKENLVLDDSKLKDFNIDFEEVKNYWLSLTNNVRKEKGLKNYNYSQKLEQTAFSWSKVQKSRGTRTHQRDKGDSFYDYNKINYWFKEKGVSCKNIYRVTFSENVGSRGFSCNGSNCTENIKKALKHTFDFYMSEKDKESSPHYNCIVNKYFSQIGIGLDIEKKRDNYFKYYLTIHYCTELQ